MHARSAQRRLTAWLGIAAVALHFLLPWASQAFSSMPAVADLCSVQSIGHAAPDAGGALPAQDDGLPSGPVHCPFCVLHLAHWAPLPAVAALVLEPFAVPRWLRFEPLFDEARAPPALS